MAGKKPTAREMQQELAGWSGYEDKIFWDLYGSDSLDVLINKVELLFPDATADNCHPTLKNNRKLLEKHNEEMKVTRNTIRAAIWAQRKYYGGKLLMSIVYVLRTEEKVVLEEAQFDTNFHCHPLFRIRKCRSDYTNVNCCMVFVDQFGRVYKNWSDYKKNNQLPEGTLVAPRYGVYRNRSGKVELEYFLSPASGEENKSLVATDKGANVLGLVSSVAPIASIFTPVGPVILGASLIGGAAAGIWSVLRSLHNLADRDEHGQSIALTDRQARSSWLGVGAGAIGIGAVGATSVLARSSAAGRNIPKVALGAVNTLNVTSTVFNGLSITNGAIDLILKSNNGEKITVSDCLQMSVSLFLFTHSVRNFQTASKILQTSQDNSIKGFRDGLSNRQRKIFDKMARNTISTKGAQQGKVDIIRSLRNIPDKRMYFSDVKQSLKQLSKNNVKPSFNPDGTVLLNNDVSVTSTAIRQNIKESPAVILSKIKSAPAEQTLESIDLVNQLKLIPMESSFNSIRRLKEIIAKKFEVQNETSLLSTLIKIEALAEEARDKLKAVVELFLKVSKNSIQEKLGRTLPYEDVLKIAYDEACSFKKPVNQFIMETSESDLKDMISEYYDNLIKIVEKRVTLICSQLPINDRDSLKNCLLHLYENLTEEAADKILRIANSVFTGQGLIMDRSIIEFIEFDQFLFDAFMITLKLTVDKRKHEATSTNVLSLDDADIQKRIISYYAPSYSGVGRRVKCETCHGWYFLSQYY